MTAPWPCGALPLSRARRPPADLPGRAFPRRVRWGCAPLPRAAHRHCTRVPGQPVAGQCGRSRGGRGLPRPRRSPHRLGRSPARRG
eukprot:3384858-Pleurochrysis_carterae.AAC.1